MTPTHWLGRAAIVIAALPLLLDAMLAPTSPTLFLLALLWLAVAAPYMYRSRKRKRHLYRQFPQHRFQDPDQPLRKRIAVIFFVVGLLIWSGAWQRAIIYISLPSLNAYADHLYSDTPLVAPLPTAPVWCGLLHVTPIWMEPGDIEFQVGFGELLYSPEPGRRSYRDYLTTDEWLRYWETTYTPISPSWRIERPQWNFLMPSLYR